MDESLLEAVYEKLIAYELDRQQRKKRNKGKTKSMALIIQDDKKVIPKVKNIESTVIYSKKKKVVVELESSDTDPGNSNSGMDMKEFTAMFDEAS